MVALGLAAAVVCRWFEGERRESQASRVSGDAGFAVQTLVDPAGSLTLDQVLAHPGSFASSPAPRHARWAWYRITVANDSDSVRHAVLGVTNDFAQDVRLYEPGSGGRYRAQAAGATVRWFERAVPAQTPAFRVDLRPARHRPLRPGGLWPACMNFFSGTTSAHSTAWWSS